MKLMLDREALLSLFPEDSEARIELRRVVTNALVEKLAIKDIKYLDEELRDEIRTQTKKAMSAFGVQERWNGEIQVSTKLLAHIDAIVKDRFQVAINEAITKSLTADVLENTQTMVARRLENKLDVLVTTGLHDRVREILRIMLKGS
jgi:hypothetical protein